MVLWLMRLLLLTGTVVNVTTVVDWYCEKCDYCCWFIVWLMWLLLWTDTAVNVTTVVNGTVFNVTTVVDWYCG